MLARLRQHGWAASNDNRVAASADSAIRFTAMLEWRWLAVLTSSIIVWRLTRGGGLANITASLAIVIGLFLLLLYSAAADDALCIINIARRK